MNRFVYLPFPRRSHHHQIIIFPVASPLLVSICCLVSHSFTLTPKTTLLEIGWFIMVSLTGTTEAEFHFYDSHCPTKEYEVWNVKTKLHIWEMSTSGQNLND